MIFEILVRTEFIWFLMIFVNLKEHLMDALVSGGDERGRRLPKASVSCQSSYDPKISEWGNPTREDLVIII